MPVTKNKIRLLAASTLLSLAVLELGLRLFTAFPLGASNVVAHDVLGYALKPSAPGLDAFGFRNAPGSQRGADIAAIGDSHTFGLRVSSNQAWPVVLSERSGREVYNYGVPGYTPYQYHVLAQQAIQDGARCVLVGLLLQLEGGSDLGLPCDLLDRPYFEEVFNPSVSNAFVALCQGQAPPARLDHATAIALRSDETFHSVSRKLKHLLKSDIAISSAYYWLYHTPRHAAPRFETQPGGLSYRTMVNETLFSEAALRMSALQQTLRSVQEHCASQSVAFGLLLLPSVGRSLSLVQSTDPPWTDATPQALQQECALVEEMKAYLEHQDIAFIDTAPFLAAAFRQRFPQGDFHKVLVPWDSHPRQLGYAAYAEAANELLLRMDRP